jgi:hypothetical protein
MVKTMEKDPATGAYIYIAKVNIAYDYIIKTMANLYPVKYAFYPVTELNDITSTHFKPTAIPPFGVTISGLDIYSIGKGYSGEWGLNRQLTPGNTGWKPATGVLAAGWDYGSLVYNTQEPTTWYVGSDINPVGISCSLTNWKDTTETNRALANDFGNRAVRVVADIETTAYQDPVLYEYYREIDGNVFKIDSSSTKMGFYDAKLIPRIDSAGRVPTYISPSDYFTITNEGVRNAGVEALAEQDPAGDQVFDSTVPGMETTTIRAFYRCSATYNTYLTSVGADPTYILGKPASFHVPTGVTAQNFESVVPQSMNVTMTDRLQPYTNVSRAIYNGRAVGFEHYFITVPGLADSNYDGKFFTDDFAYRVTIENTYIVHRVVITSLIKTINDILYVPASGVPVDVNDFKDYGINYIGVFNPSMNDAGGVIIINASNIADLIFDFLSQYGWMIVIAIIGIAVIVIAPAFRKKSGGGKPSRFNWFKRN